MIALGILAISVHTLWADYRDTWQEAERTSQNITTTIARDLGGDLELMDFSLKGAAERLRYVGFDRLPPDFKHHMLFDRAVSASLMTAVLIVDETGNLVMDAGPAIAPRDLNVADRDYFTVQKENSYVGLYVSRPYHSRITDDLSIGISRRLQHADGRFAGIAMASISLADLNSLFKDLSLGHQGTINLFRGDGVLLTRHPFDESQVNQDFGGSPHVQRLLQSKSGTFESVSPIDGVRRIISFQRLGHFPLVLTVALSVDETFNAWNRKALVLGFVTAMLCSVVVGLTVLFQCELRRRTKAETKLKRIARTDDLTGLPNRRAYREMLEREWRQAIRSGSALSLLYVDVDYFKSFNDRYGHGKGDEVLRALARALETNIRRPRDTAFRHGGEEFSVVLPETDLAGARLIAQAIRQAIMALAIVHEGSPYQAVTASIGVASARPSRGSPDAALLEAADAALYQAKAAGRNCVYGAEAHATQPGDAPEEAAPG